MIWLSGSFSRSLSGKLYWINKAKIYAEKEHDGITAMTQWVHDPASVEMLVQSPARHSGLRIQCCCSCGAGHSASSDLIPGQGTSICHGCSWKRKKKKKEEERKGTLTIPCLLSSCSVLLCLVSQISLRLILICLISILKIVFTCVPSVQECRDHAHLCSQLCPSAPGTALSRCSTTIR